MKTIALLILLTLAVSGCIGTEKQVNPKDLSLLPSDFDENYTISFTSDEWKNSDASREIEKLFPQPEVEESYFIGLNRSGDLHISQIVWTHKSQHIAVFHVNETVVYDYFENHVRMQPLGVGDIEKVYNASAAARMPHYLIYFSKCNISERVDVEGVNATFEEFKSAVYKAASKIEC